MKYFAYVLKSQKDQKFYIGISKDPSARLIEHNQGMTRSTRSRRPFALIYQEICENRIEARKKEKWLKSGAGHATLHAILVNSAKIS